MSDKKHDCIDCKYLQLPDAPEFGNVRCAAPLPANIDFGWSMGRIEIGHFFCQHDYFKDCELWQGPADESEIRRRADVVDAQVIALNKRRRDIGCNFKYIYNRNRFKDYLDQD